MNTFKIKGGDGMSAVPPASYFHIIWGIIIGVIVIIIGTALFLKKKSRKTKHITNLTIPLSYLLIYSLIRTFINFGIKL
jgi:hypothetical protein